MSTVSNAAKISDVLTNPSLYGLATNAYASPSNLIDNTPANGRGLSFLRGMIRLTITAPLTAGPGSPYVRLFILKAADGTNLPVPPGNAPNAPAPNAFQVTRQLIASASFQILDFPEFDLDPDIYGFQILNQAGNGLFGSPTMTLYRWNALVV